MSKENKTTRLSIRLSNTYKTKLNKIAEMQKKTITKLIEEYIDSINLN